MIWIPVLYICLASGSCAFMQGTPTYSENGCKEQLAQVVRALQQEPRVSAFDGTCVFATPT
jgi:hypothetical protein